MEKILNFQLSLFGGFVDLKPETDIIIKLLTNLSSEKFVPSTVDVAILDALTKKITSESRIQMISQDKQWSVVFLADRIDINYEYNGEATIYNNFDDVVNYSNILLSKVFLTFPETKGNRLAMNCRVLLNICNSEEVVKFTTRFSTPLSLYGDLFPTEWSVRWNVRDKIKINDENSEICNRITELSMINFADESGSSSRIVAILDTNTLAENVINRFKYDNLADFSQNAKEYMSKVLLEVEKNDQ